MMSSGSGRAITPWLFTRSCMASALTASHHDQLSTLQPWAQTRTMACRSAGRLSQACLLMISSVTLVGSCQPVV